MPPPPIRGSVMMRNVEPNGSIVGEPVGTGGGAAAAARVGDGVVGNGGVGRGVGRSVGRGVGAWVGLSLIHISEPTRPY